MECCVDSRGVTILTISSEVVYAGLWREFPGGKVAWKIVVGQSLQPPGSSEWFAVGIWINSAEVSSSCPLRTAMAVASHTHQ